MGQDLQSFAVLADGFSMLQVRNMPSRKAEGSS